MAPHRLSSEGTPLTAAELLRRRSKQAVKSEEDHKGASTDLDDEIRRLEAELEHDDSSSKSSNSSDDSGSEEDIPKRSEASGPVVNLSSVAADRIQPLPSSCLPSNKRRVLKCIDKDETVSPLNKKSRVSEGLQSAVQEVLNGYTARSAERLPLYCRFCAKQYEDERKFFQHQESDFHQLAVEMERKATYCKLCHKQMTSPAQMKEHLSSRPHKERLTQVQNKRGNQSNSRGRDPYRPGSR